MNIREYKLAIACENITTDIKALNKYFDVWFSDMIKHITEKGFVFYVKNDKCVLNYDLSLNEMWCHYDIWDYLFNFNNSNGREFPYSDSSDIIQYMIYQYLKIDAIPHYEDLHNVTKSEQILKLHLDKLLLNNAM